MPDNVHNRHRDYLAHHGIKGQKWGVRRYQNPDGSLTEAGKNRYLNSTGDWYRPSSKNPFVRKKERTMKDAYYAKRHADADRALDEIASMKDKTKKAAAEARILRVYSGTNNEWDNASPEEYALVDRVFNRVRERYGNWYENIPASKEFQSQMKQYRRNVHLDWDKKIDFSEYVSRQTALEKEMSKTALEKIGFEVTPENIELLIPFIITD